MLLRSKECAPMAKLGTDHRGLYLAAVVWTFSGSDLSQRATIRPENP